MIKDIFIPTQIGSFYIFTERTLALKINKTEIIAAISTAHGSRRKIELLIKEPIEQDMLIEQAERTAQALTKVIERAGKYTNFVLLVPTALVLFKEISVPYMSNKKMKLVAPFEVEQLLPFPLDAAAIDSIVTQTDATTNKAQLLVAAVKHDILQAYMAPCLMAGIVPDRITTDIFELYALYEALPEYSASEAPTLLVDIGTQATQLGIIINKQLKFVRSIPKGLPYTATSTAETEAPHLEDAAVQQAVNKILADITFTLENFSAKRSPAMPTVERIIVAGQAVDIKGLDEYITQHMGITCSLLPINKLLYMGDTSSKNGLMNEYLIPVAASLPLQATQEFNLNQKLADASLKSSFTKQLIAAGVITLLILVMILTNSILTKRSLKNEIQAREDQAIALLKKDLNLTIKGKKSLQEVKKLAQSEVLRKEEIWSKLSRQNRFSFLMYLQELSTRLNREALGLELRQLIISEDTHTIMLDGQVKNFPALATLEENLNQSPLFESVSKPQDTTFNVKIVLNKSQNEG